MEATVAESLGERVRRPIRNKKYNRRVFGEEKRPPKRLFTPEIKRFLKDWLVRRRDNPYPNRDEKKTLAIQTGLTYIQVCNWFANWRRKLKNAGKEPQRKTWGHLIKTYNTQVHGNVEHFSICSDDSIWGENETRSSDDYKLPPHDLKPDLLTSKPNYEPNPAMDHSYTERDPIKPETLNNNTESEPHQNQCFLISSTTENDVLEHNPFAQQKYKNHIMEKYLRDCQKPPSDFLEDVAKPSMISKWLESAVNFRPSENNYLNWTLSKGHRKKCGKKNGVSQESVNGVYLQHGREELDAAEALTTLASVHAERKL